MKVQALFEALKTFKVFHATKVVHARDILTNGFDPKKSSDFRLVPNTVSFDKQPAHYGGSEVMLRATIEVDESKVLKVSLRKPKEDEKDFYSFGKELDSPINRGKELVKYAKKNKYQMIIVRGVVGVGTEYCVLDPKIIKHVEQYFD